MGLDKRKARDNSMYYISDQTNLTENDEEYRESQNVHPYALFNKPVVKKQKTKSTGDLSQKSIT